MQTCNHGEHCDIQNDECYIKQFIADATSVRNYICSIIATVSSSEDMQLTARMYYFAPEMYKALKKVVAPDDFIATKEMEALLQKIEGKDE
ncbi:MAG: hypothetical protein IJM68_00820 [Synergistaceae bacterium]|nr:hypothetical protein [Synergistaceae bacterium]